MATSSEDAAQQMRQAVRQCSVKACSTESGTAETRCFWGKIKGFTNINSAPDGAYQADQTMLTFQQIILKLQEYWDKQGCALLQPYDMEVGAEIGRAHV